MKPLEVEMAGGAGRLAAFRGDGFLRGGGQKSTDVGVVFMIFMKCSKM